jgi:predicted Zn-dependent protease
MKKKKLLFALFSLSFLFLYRVKVEGQLGPGSGPGSFGDISGALSQMERAFESTQEGMTAEDDYYTGRAVAAGILNSYKIDKGNPGLTRYLNKICLALTVNSRQPVVYNGYHVEILDSNEINAFATPGGHIFLTRGLVECADSEDALAAVIAHEVAHIQLRHAAGIIENQRLVQDLTNTANRAASIAARNLSPRERAVLFGESVTEAINVLLKNGYAQSQEFEADQAAAALLRNAGYEPSSLVEVLKILERDQKNHPGGFNLTHPSPSLRITNAERYVRGYQTRDTRSYRQARFRSSR